MYDVGILNSYVLCASFFVFQMTWLYGHSIIIVLYSDILNQNVLTSWINSISVKGKNRNFP